MTGRVVVVRALISCCWAVVQLKLLSQWL